MRSDDPRAGHFTTAVRDQVLARPRTWSSVTLCLVLAACTPVSSAYHSALQSQQDAIDECEKLSGAEQSECQIKALGMGVALAPVVIAGALPVRLGDWARDQYGDGDPNMSRCDNVCVSDHRGMGRVVPSRKWYDVEDCNEIVALTAEVNESALQVSEITSPDPLAVGGLDVALRDWDTFIQNSNREFVDCEGGKRLTSDVRFPSETCLLGLHSERQIDIPAGDESTPCEALRKQRHDALMAKRCREAYDIAHRRLAQGYLTDITFTVPDYAPQACFDYADRALQEWNQRKATMRPHEAQDAATAAMALGAPVTGGRVYTVADWLRDASTGRFPHHPALLLGEVAQALPGGAVVVETDGERVVVEQATKRLLREGHRVQWAVEFVKIETYVNALGIPVDAPVFRELWG